MRRGAPAEPALSGAPCAALSSRRMRATMAANELARRQTQTVTAIRQASHSLTVATQGKGFSEITGALASWLTEIGGTNGLLTVFVRHTSASLTIQENADPNVQRDLLDALEAFAPEGADYAHQEEGPDDMPSHIKAMLTSVSLGIPVVDGKMTLGTWQGVYLIEHRASPHRRTVVLSFIGEARS